jgi:hypothetical protein
VEIIAQNVGKNVGIKLTVKSQGYFCFPWLRIKDIFASSWSKIKGIFWKTAKQG